MSVDFLVSYHFARDNPKLLQAALSPGMSSICDSGAFSAASTGAAIVLGDYARWLRQWQHRFAWCASLDVIGDPQGSFDNWATLRDTWQLTTVPTIHFGTDPVWLTTYHRHGATLIGLGGMVGQPAARVRPWLVACFRAARRLPGVAFHGWGFAHGPTLAALPFYSVDSSGPLTSSYRYGRLSLFDARHHRTKHIDLDGRQVWRHADLLRRGYGVDPAAIATATADNRMLLVRLGMRSVQQHAAWLRARHRVAPPAHLGPAAATGTRVHSVDVTPDVSAELARLAAEQLANNERTPV